MCFCTILPPTFSSSFYFSVYPFLGVVPEDVEMVKVQSYNHYSFHNNT